MGSLVDMDRLQNRSFPAVQSPIEAALATLIARDYLVSLEPEPVCAQRILAYKDRVAELVGEQRYLNDPPHLMLYQASFPSGDRLRRVLDESAATLTAPVVRVDRWRVFESDPLTGDTSIACDIVAADRQILQGVQLRVVQALGDHRDPELTRHRYAQVWPQLSQIERNNIRAAGFPFVGSMWRPHMVVASVRPADWSVVWRELSINPPSGPVCFDSLNLYEKDDDRLVLIDTFKLRSTP